eukprot:TRINITY_DN66215_c0_g1_i1.p2 TRINITY_DN66215_c0_g1~~TRINITY_DN66215_c0_g1_i1.p2  ORF type:complete len:101 (+),score=43.77 TRINITY_DN66215_c0_g1_i1:105-407(+)
MGVITDAFSRVLGTSIEKGRQIRDWLSPHLWRLTTSALVIAVPLLIAGEADKARLLNFNGRLGDKLEHERKDTSQQDLVSKLCDMDTGLIQGKDSDSEFD